MARRAKLRMTNADYVAIAVSPALIMALVGSLVFFLIDVLYVGQYQARLNYVFALFVFATVLIGRISIEMGADRAALYALPLAVAMFLVLAKFVQYSSPYSHLINIALLAVVWWSAHKLTWDCTLIDDNEDASGEGLMQRVGVDESFSNSEDAPGATGNELLVTDPTKKANTPHTPGLWVLYFSLAALPLFGIGQKWIPVGDVGRRQYAFALLAIYVAAGLALLVTTSFLGLRRYLRQRHIEMPTPMAATWVVTGGMLIVLVMLLAALVPRPHAEYAISQVPWQARSPADLASSRNNFGEKGTEDEDTEGRKITNDETDPSATATREGDNPTATVDESEEQSSSGEGETKTESADSPTSSEQSETTSSDESPPADTPSKQTESSTQAELDDSSPRTPQEASPDTRSKATEESPPSESANAESTAEPVRAPRSLPNLNLVFNGLAGIAKLVLYAAIALALGYLAWRKRQEIAQALREIVQLLREFWTRLFGGATAESAGGLGKETAQPKGPPPKSFASYSDPFVNGQSHTLPSEELVRYTFEAFEAWAREQGHPRSPDQTPLELIRQSVPRDSQLWPEALHLTQLYNEVAYAPSPVSESSVARLAKLWSLLRQQASLRSASVS